MVMIHDGFERVFRHFDEDGDGKISPKELSKCLAMVGGEGVVLEEAEAMVEWLDSDGDGMVGVEDLVGLLAEERGEEERMEEMREAFRMYLMDGSECITPRSLKRMLSRLGEKKTNGECERMIGKFDLNGDGLICFNEFLVMMQSC